MTLDLRTATPAEIADALQALEGERPGLAYDVGMLLWERKVSKEFPGPPPGPPPHHPGFHVPLTPLSLVGIYHEDRTPVTKVLVTGYDKARRLEAMQGLRALWDLPLLEVKPLFDSLDAGREVCRNFTDTFTAGEEIKALTELGITIQVVRDGDVPGSHRRSMGELGYPARAWA